MTCDNCGTDKGVCKRDTGTDIIPPMLCGICDWAREHDKPLYDKLGNPPVRMPAPRRPRFVGWFD